MHSDVTITDEMVEAACRAYWPLHWPNHFAKADAESIEDHIRAALEAVAPSIAEQARLEEREACARMLDERAKKALRVIGCDAVGQLEGAADDLRNRTLKGDDDD